MFIAIPPPMGESLTTRRDIVTPVTSSPTPTDRPEQARAREYLRAKGTARPRSEIRERVAAAFATLETLVDGVGEVEARARPRPGEWTVQEIVDHLVETHRPSIIELRDLLAGQWPATAPIPASLQSPDPMARSWPELVAELRRLQAEVVQILGDATDNLTEARAPLTMVITIRDEAGMEQPLHWIEELDWKAYAIVFRLHVLDHLTQIRKALTEIRSA